MVRVKLYTTAGLSPPDPQKSYLLQLKRKIREIEVVTAATTYF